MRKKNNKPTILIVDDEKSICDLTSEDLSRRGYLCCTAPDGVMALKEMQKQHFDIALLDVILPVMSGLELLSKIRSEYPSTLVVMITGVSSADGMLEAFRLGALHYVIKPFDLDELAAIIRLALETNSGSADTSGHHSLASPDKASIKRLISKASSLEEKDEFNAGHSKRVSKISISMAQQVGMAQTDIDKLEIAALIHDIGMIGVSDSIQAMKSKPSNNQFQRIAYHCEAGALILERTVKDNDILNWVKHHHERCDEGGYPDGLSADEIPMGAKILAVAEAYDAMTSRRPYRSAMSAEAACAEIKRCRGSQFDPDAADALLRIKGALIHDTSKKEVDNG